MIDASQIVIPTTSAPWFDPVAPDRLIAPIHPEISETCPACGITRWMPVGMDVLPLPSADLLADESPVVASPGWFGAGKQSFSQILWRRDLAEFLVASSPKDFTIDAVGKRYEL